MSQPAQGLRVSKEQGEAALREAACMATNYRGDVTLSTLDNPALTCFVFDCTNDVLRYMTPDGDRRACRLVDLRSVEFSGKDTAAGITFDKWVKRYVERTLAGQNASLESNDLTT